MRCKKDDIAIITGAEELLDVFFERLNGRMVKCVALEYVPHNNRGGSMIPLWRLEEAIPVTPKVDFYDGYGRFVHRGQKTNLGLIEDRMLTPIRDPGEDAVDEMVRRVGSARALPSLMRLPVKSCDDIAKGQS